MRKKWAIDANFNPERLLFFKVNLIYFYDETEEFFFIRKYNEDAGVPEEFGHGTKKSLIIFTSYGRYTVERKKKKKVRILNEI